MSHAGADGGLRLALCSVGELFGGVERQLLGLCADRRRRTGAFPLLILFHDLELARQARALGVEPVILRGRHRYDPGLARRLAATLGAHGIQVVHAHGYKAMVACALARRRRRFAVVKTEHGRPEPTRGSPVAWLKSRLNRALDTWATRRAADVVCYVTEDIARHHERAHGGLLRRVVHNGIDPLERAALPRPPELEPGLCHLGIVGRVTPVKGIEYALRALASPEVPAAVRLSIIGDGPAAPSLRREAAALGLGERVRFLGFRDNIYDYLAHLDALLMPSLHEGLPYVLLEAMSLGVPVIASRVGGLAEVLRDGQTGWLAPVGDVAAWRRLIIRTAAEPEAARRLGAAAAAAQRAAYTLESMGEAVASCYELAAARTSGGAEADGRG